MQKTEPPQRGTKRKHIEDKVLEKARKFIPLEKKVPENFDALIKSAFQETSDPKSTVDPPTKLPKVKKPRKTIRAQDGSKIRPIPPPPPVLEEVKKKKWPRKKNKTTTDPPPVIAEVAEESSKKKSKKKKKNKKKKSSSSVGLLTKTPEIDKRHGFKALEFLNRWKNDRSDWKFEKLRQVWLLSNALNSVEMNELNFEVLLEYIATVKGRAREQTLKEMQDTMKTIEKKFNKNTDDSERYDRARRIVQMLSDSQ